MNKSIVVFLSIISLVGCLLVSFFALTFVDKLEPTQQAKTIDEYIIINVRLSQSIDGSTFFLFDYAKNGEPMTVYLPSPESVETFTNRLERLGSVIWLCDEPTQ